MDFFLNPPDQFRWPMGLTDLVARYAGMKHAHAMGRVLLAAYDEEDRGRQMACDC